LVVDVVVVMTGVIIPALLVVLVVLKLKPTAEVDLTLEYPDRVTTLVFLFQVTLVLVVVVLVLSEATLLGARAGTVVTVRQVR
jgi:hypothetical protein